MATEDHQVSELQPEPGTAAQLPQSVPPQSTQAAQPAELAHTAQTAQPPQSVLPYLRALSELGGSDLHCKVGGPPRVRIDGRLRRLQAPELTEADTEYMVQEVLRADLVTEFARTHEADFAFNAPGGGRYRVNAFRARGGCGLVFRRVSVGALPLGALGLPPVIATLASEPRGLVLVTGPTGSGKTTTLAGMIDHVNTTKEVHVVTIEDPIEIIHEDKLSMINQREVRVDTADFSVAM
ncbi:MAG: type IV pilus twitching motility protein PilT, partial [Actinomycetales bacterium]